MKTITRFLIPVFVLAVLAASVVGVAFAKQLEVDGSHSDSSEIEFTGALEAIDATSWTVSGKVVAVTASTELKGTLMVGDMVKVHAFIADDGTLTAREIEHFIGSGGGNSNEDDDDSNDNGNSNEGQDDNGNEGQDDNSNDNGNSNEDDDDSNANGNSNEDDDDGNANGNSNEDDDDSNANGNSNEDDDDSNSNGNSNEDDDDSNDNGNDDSSGRGRGG